METVITRAQDYANKNWGHIEGYHADYVAMHTYIACAEEQRKIDNEKAKTAFDKACGWLSVYPWYNEVFEEFIKTMEE